MLTFLVAVIGLGIAFGQWWLAHRRLKMDLFDRRWAVYAAYCGAYRNVLTKRNLPVADIVAFNEATAGAEWLFNRAVADFLNEFIYAADEIDNQSFLVETTGPSEGKVAARQMQIALRRELIRKQNEANKLFAPFMHIDQPLAEWLSQTVMDYRRKGGSIWRRARLRLHL